MSILKRVLVKVSGNRFMQRLMEKNANLAHFLMGIGSGGDPNSSGERLIFETLKKHCHEPFCVFDVGANQGQFLQLLLTNIGTEKFSVHCFEPGVETFKRLTQSAPNDPRIRLINVGLGKEAGTAELHYDAQGSGLASLTKRRLEHHNIDFSQSEPVTITTIDQYCSENGIERIQLLKLDIEGHELDALAGAQEMFRRKAIDVVTFEFGGCNIDTRSYLQDFWYFLQDVNMDLYRITPSGYLSPITSYKEHHEQFRTTNFIALASND